MSQELADSYVEALIGVPAVPGGKPRRRWKRLTPEGDDAALVPDVLYRYELLDPANEVVALNLYLGVGGVGGLLWEQEVRTLERIAGLDHRALPRFVDGGRIEGLNGDAGAAYVRMYREGSPASQDENRLLLRSNRGEALMHLWYLADALSTLHDAKISHQGLWPGALSMKSADDKIDSISLTRFEMSALLANMFRMRGSTVHLEQLRSLYMREDPLSRIYMPPERCKFVFDLPNGTLGGPKGDIFSLGMIAADWLLGIGAPSASIETIADVRAIQADVRASLQRRSNELPGQFAQTLLGMLEDEPGSRPTAFDVVRSISAGFSDARAVLSGEMPDVPYLVGVMRDETDQTLLKWKFVEHSALTDDGLDELTERVQRDMRGAEILHSPTGAEGFAGGSVEKLRRAKTVIIGREITWFCERLWVGSSEFNEMMIVKFVRKSSDISATINRLRVGTLVDKVPMVDVEPMPKDIDVARHLCRGRPDWQVLVKPSGSSDSWSETERDYLGTLEWYLQYQRALLDSRTYAYVLDPGHAGTATATLRWNIEDDYGRKLTRNELLSGKSILDTRRPDLASFVRDADETIQYGSVRLFEHGEMSFGNRGRVYEVVDVFDPDTVEFALQGKPLPPERGWLRLEGDSGTETQIARQKEAVRELATNRTLLRQLIEPKEVLNRLAQNPGFANSVLQGEGREAVHDILIHDSLFALQGPPGTGKTEVTSEAVFRYVKDDPGARVLVSAQSHDALENLAVRICKKLGIIPSPGSEGVLQMDTLALRVQSSRADRKPHPELAVLTPSNMADRVIAHSVARAQDWLSTSRAERSSLVPVVQDWISRIRSAHPEISRRVRSAANIVFATTGVATRERLNADVSDEPFDWVVVEEAGRAWPTELALPLVRGMRWTLVGDHAQIGAYRRGDVERFLIDLENYEEPQLKAMFDARERHLRNFSTFERFFDGTLPSAAVRSLKEQYRMDEAISSVVGDVFYSASGGLRALRERAPHPLQDPAQLREQRLVWVDTGRAERSVGFWANEYEASLCSNIVRSMDPLPGGSHGPSLAVLTPYRGQVKVLQGRLSEHVERIHTVDGFQGREADIVVASLVRDRLRPGATAVQTVGHVSSPERINVMLSRAREMVVIVGRLDVYENAAGPEWAAIVHRFRSDGVVYSAAEFISEE